MKNTLLLILVSLISFNCSKENISQDGTILLPSVREFISDEYKQNSFAVFNNMDQDTLVLEISYNEGTATHELGDDSSVEMEDFKISLSSIDNSNLLILIIGTAFISQDLEIIKPSVNIELMPFQSGNVWMDIKVDEGIINSTSMSSFDQKLNLNLATFKDVYSVSENSLSSYSSLHYNKEFGVVGFKDSYEVLWSLSHFKN